MSEVIDIELLEAIEASKREPVYQYCNGLKIPNHDVHAVIHAIERRVTEIERVLGIK